MNIFSILFLPFRYIRLILEYIISSFAHIEIYGYTLGSNINSPLFPISLQPKYRCSSMEGWSCYDAGSFTFWLNTLIIIIIAIFVYILLKKPRKKAYIFAILYASFYIGFLLSQFLINFIFPEPKPHY